MDSMLMVAVAPDPNSVYVLSWDFIWGCVLGAVFVWAFRWRRIGFFVRICTVVALVLLSAMATALVDLAINHPGQWPKASAAAAGAALTASCVGTSAYRNRKRRDTTDARLSARLKLLDYPFGFAAYLLAAFGLASYASQSTTSKIATVVGVFLASQVTINLLVRWINRVLEHEYLTSFGWHYGLAALPVLASAGVYIVLGQSPGGPIFRLALLGAAWRYTHARPNSVIKTFRSLWRWWRTGRRTESSAGSHGSRTAAAESAG
jgi:hypothetical protein